VKINIFKIGLLSSAKMSLKDFLILDFGDLTNWLGLLFAGALFFFAYWITFH